MTFAAGDMTPRTVTVQVNRGHPPVPRKQFLVIICSASNDVRAGAPAVGTIRNGAGTETIDTPLVPAGWGCSQ
jgi:hypothetical protein